MKHVVRGLVAALLTIAVGVVAPSPASAHTEVCVGQGTATTPPLYYAFFSSSSTGTFQFGIGTGICLPGMGVLNASGTLSGWCGLSLGSGTVNGHKFHFVGAGSLLVLGPQTLPALSSLVVGVANLVPDVTTTPAQNCLTGATKFLVTGAVAMIL